MGWRYTYVVFVFIQQQGCRRRRRCWIIVRISYEWHMWIVNCESCVSYYLHVLGSVWSNLNVDTLPTLMEVCINLWCIVCAVEWMESKQELLWWPKFLLPLQERTLSSRHRKRYIIYRRRNWSVCVCVCYARQTKHFVGRCSYTDSRRWMNMESNWWWVHDFSFAFAHSFGTWENFSIYIRFLALPMWALCVCASAKMRR